MHRVLWFVLAGGVVLGSVGGWTAQRVLRGEGGLPILVGVALVGLVVAFPLLWGASVMLSRPVMRLAHVAHQLQEGRLESRRELRSAGDEELDQVSEALGGLAERVSQQLRDQQALLAAVSHELRSPLGRLRVLTELLRDGLASPSAYDEVQEEIDGMDALVGDLLARSRIDFEAVAPEELAVADVVARAVEVSGASVAVHEAEGTVHADPTLLVRALRGMLDNAERHGGGGVSLQVRMVEDAVRFEVLDEGRGFAAGEEEMAFQPFWRRPGEAPGTGLGLALVRQIAEVHGGSAGAENRASGGARVWLEVPAQG